MYADFWASIKGLGQGGETISTFVGSSLKSESLPDGTSMFKNYAVSCQRVHAHPEIHTSLSIKSFSIRCNYKPYRRAIEYLQRMEIILIALEWKPSSLHEALGFDSDPLWRCR